MTSVSLQERLEAATEDLARCQVAADVAGILRVEGVQGERADCESCPIAVLLLKRLGPGVIAEAGESYLTARLLDSWAPGADVPSSAGVRAFIGEFDGDDDLEDGPRRWDEFAVTSP